MQLENRYKKTGANLSCDGGELRHSCKLLQVDISGPWCTISRTPRFDLTFHIDKSLSCRLAWPPYRSRTAYPCDSWRKEGPGREHGISGKGSAILSEIQGGDDQEQGSGQELPSLKVLKGEVVASLATKSNRGWAKGLLPGPTPSLLLLPRLQRLDGQIAF
jgi:hypothetical protein